MHLRLRRRRFGQLAIASAATTLLANIATKTVAQSQLTIYGVRLTPASSKITEDIADDGAANKTPGIILQAINLVTGQDLSTTEISEQFVQNQQDPTETANKAFVIQRPSERITGLTALSNGTFVVAVAAVTKKGDFSRFIVCSQDSRKSAPRGLKAKKLKKNHTIESLLAIQNDQLISIVSTHQGQPPFELAVINSKSGQVDAGNTLNLPHLMPLQRFSNLAQSAEGKIYATTVDPEGIPTLVQFDLKNVSQITGRGRTIEIVRLSFNKRLLESDIASLAFSSSNQLFALADPTHEGTNSLFTVDLKTGEMQLLRKFAVDKIAFSKVQKLIDTCAITIISISTTFPKFTYISCAAMTNTRDLAKDDTEPSMYPDRVNIAEDRQSQSIDTINVGVIGYGYWGPNLVRSFAELPGAQVTAVSDFKLDRLAKVQSRYPTIKVTTNTQDLFADPKIDAIAIATPVSTHYDLALAALQAGKHVLVEKPMTVNSEQAKRLIEEAERRNLVLMVDHTFVYTGAVRKMRELVATKVVGDVYYYDSVRVNLGLFQHDVNVLWDLAVHDLSIMDYVLQSKPYAVSATGMSHVPGEPENIAYLTLFFANNSIAHIHVNWLAPVKVRRTLLGGSQKMISYDDLEPSEKIKVYDKGIMVNGSPENVYQMLVGYRTGDMWAPKLEMTEALQTEAIHFIQCIRQGDLPITGGDAGLRVVKILEAATESMNKQGALIELDMERVAV